MIRNPIHPDPWALTRDVRAFVSRHPAPFWGDVVTVTGEWPICSVSFVVPDLTRLILSTNGAKWSATVLGGTTEEDALRSLSQCDAVPRGPVELLSARVADCLQLRGGTCDTLPPWLAGPVSHQLINRARALLTSAGISPADTVMAAETLDEALCRRAPVAATVSDVLATLQAIGMSCRWVVGADIPELDYIRTLELNLQTTCRQRDALLVAAKQALTDLDRYDRSDGQQALAPLDARAVLRRVLGVT